MKVEGFPGGSVAKNPLANAGDANAGESACQCRIFLSQEDPLGKETATHSCILAWEIPWTEVPGGL